MANTLRDEIADAVIGWLMDNDMYNQDTANGITDDVCDAVKDFMKRQIQ